MSGRRRGGRGGGWEISCLYYYLIFIIIFKWKVKRIKLALFFALFLIFHHGSHYDYRFEHLLKIDLYRCRGA